MGRRGGQDVTAPHAPTPPQHPQSYMSSGVGEGGANPPTVHARPAQPELLDVVDGGADSDSDVHDAKDEGYDRGDDDDIPLLERVVDHEPDHVHVAEDGATLAEERPEQVRRSSRSTRGAPPTRYGDLYAHSAKASATEPKTWRDAANDPKWRAAALSEMDSLRDSGVYTVITKSDVPTSERIIPTKWVWKQKVDASGRPGNLI